MCNRETEERNRVRRAGCSGWQIKSQLMTLLFARSQWMEDYPWDSGTGPRHADSVCGCDGVGSSLSAARGERGSVTGWMLSRFQRLRHTSTPQTLMAEQLLECYSLHYTQSSAWCDTQRITPPTQQQQDRGAELTLSFWNRNMHSRLISVFLYWSFLLFLSNLQSSSWCLHTISTYHKMYYGSFSSPSEEDICFVTFILFSVNNIHRKKRRSITVNTRP